MGKNAQHIAPCRSCNGLLHFTCNMRVAHFSNSTPLSAFYIPHSTSWTLLFCDDTETCARVKSSLGGMSQDLGTHADGSAMHCLKGLHTVTDYAAAMCKLSRRCKAIC